MNLLNTYHLEKVILKNFVILTEEEQEFVRNWRNHEDIRTWMYSDAIISPNEHINFIHSLQNDTKNQYWVVSNENNEYIGVIYLNRIDIKNKNAFLGIYANPKCSMRGKGDLLINCIKVLAFEICKLHTLKLEVIDINEKAINLYKKSNFLEEGRLREYVFKNGKWHDVIVMGITN